MVTILTCAPMFGFLALSGLRPFGVSLLYAGWDKHSGFQLYHSDPSGNYGGWKATAIGSNFQSAQSTLKTDYKEGLDLAGAKDLAVKVHTIKQLSLLWVGFPWAAPTRANLTCCARLLAWWMFAFRVLCPDFDQDDRYVSCECVCLAAFPSNLPPFATVLQM